ncbi:hypothetical protein DQ384_34705 [Sphaerisporangium album]|uniref:Uncharacterized protein n=1 Tax=Sphaerisporangium album TaxID=509200 RepID=A0A367EYK3_9ACTN|nr:hypothetical protein [Sphaerisporangium album]RCG22759.1 hypothetical protein DQ384_34705 [Sphaerisporangium album]
MVIWDPTQTDGVSAAKARAHRRILDELAAALPGTRCRRVDRFRLTLRGLTSRLTGTVILAPHLDVYADRQWLGTVYVANRREPRFTIIRRDGVLLSATFPATVQHLMTQAAQSRSGPGEGNR